MPACALCVTQTELAHKIPGCSPPTAPIPYPIHPFNTPYKPHSISPQWVRSGTTVNEGSGHMLVLAVGVHSEWGKTMALVNEAGDDETPLQEQLTDVAAKVSKM